MAVSGCVFEITSTSPARDIVSYIAYDRCRLKRGLRIAVDRIVCKHEITWKVTVGKLRDVGRSLDATFLCTARALFVDNVCCWGRILTMYVFGAYLAKAYIEDGVPVDIDRFAKTMDVFLMLRWTAWIQAHGSLDNMAAHFQEPIQDTIWRGLLIIAAVGFSTIAIRAILFKKLRLS